MVEDRDSGITEEREMDLDLDSNRRRPREESVRERSSRPSNSSASVERSPIDARASLIGKVGGSNFQSLNFITYGGEIGVYTTESITINVGVEGFATQQETPEFDLTGEETGSSLEWRVILPISVGVLYHFQEGLFARPYAGADIQVIPGYIENGGALAFGLRARGGSNIMLTDSFGFNLNLSVGFWSGQQFTAIQSASTENYLNSIGFVPQLSVGPLVLF